VDASTSWEDMTPLAASCPLKKALQKCLALDAVPVLIARRIPYVTFVVLSRCGVIMHQLYNQLLPNAAADIAAQAKQKTLLGYGDPRLNPHHTALCEPA